MKILVFGTGYVGLVTGACFAEFGFQVTCIDTNAQKIEALKQEIIPIYEPGLETLVSHNLNKGRLTFTTDKEDLIQDADIIFIAVGTPSRPEDGQADLTWVYEVAKEIALDLQGYTVIVTKSTVPVGTGREIKKMMQSLNPKAQFDVISNPEFLREGSAIEDFMKPDRVVLGCESDRAKEVMIKLYHPLKAPLIFTGLDTAELTKYASNAFLATKIAFINQMADLCEKCGADVQEVAIGMGLDKRIGNLFLNAGPGYGGSCFPKDTLALLHTAQNYGDDLSIVNAVVESNNLRKQTMAQKIISACGKDLQEQTLCILGVTFKPETDDMRDAPSLDIVPALLEKGIHLNVFDPQGFKEGQSLLPGVNWFEDPYEAMKGAEAVVILTEWNEFRALDFKKMKEILKKPLLIDLRNIYQPLHVKSEGFDYISVGRPPAYGFSPSLFSTYLRKA